MGSFVGCKKKNIKHYPRENYTIHKDNLLQPKSTAEGPFVQNYLHIPLDIDF